MTETKPIIDNEFTDIITESSLLSNNPSTLSEFTTIITETVIVSSSSSESSKDEIESPENLIKRYDELFNSPDEYIKFVKQKLTPWTNTLEFKHFDLHYCHHRADTHNIRTKRAMAQKLLEEADRLQKDHDHAQKQFHRFIATMTLKIDYTNQEKLTKIKPIQDLNNALNVFQFLHQLKESNNSLKIVNDAYRL